MIAFSFSFSDTHRLVWIATTAGIPVVTKRLGVTLQTKKTNMAKKNGKIVTCQSVEVSAMNSTQQNRLS